MIIQNRNSFCSDIKTRKPLFIIIITLPVYGRLCQPALDGTGDPVDYFPWCVNACMCALPFCMRVQPRLCLQLHACFPDSIIHNFQSKYGLPFLFIFSPSSFVYYL